MAFTIAVPEDWVIPETSVIEKTKLAEDDPHVALTQVTPPVVFDEAKIATASVFCAKVKRLYTFSWLSIREVGKPRSPAKATHIKLPAVEGVENVDEMLFIEVLFWTPVLCTIAKDACAATACSMFLIDIFPFLVKEPGIFIAAWPVEQKRKRIMERTTCIEPPI